MSAMNNPMMHPRDAVYGSLAKYFVVLEGRRYNFMSMTDFESKWDVNIVEVPILGKVGFGHKPAGGKGTWSGTAHYNQSHFRAVADHYQKTGEMPYFFKLAKTFVKKRGSGGAGVPGGGFGRPAPQASKRGCFL